MATPRTIKPRHVEKIWQRHQLKARADIVRELGELMDTMQRLSTGNQHPVTDQEIATALPSLTETLRKSYLEALEESGHLKACYGGHDSRPTGWRVHVQPDQGTGLASKS